MKLLCPFCSEPREILKEIGNFRKMDCKHLIAYNSSLEVRDSKEVESSLTIIPIPEPQEIIKEEFSNRKTGDKPYPFQEEGIEFISQSGFRCLIADEMGLGKTIQALGGLKRFKEEFFPCLILVKSKLKSQWMVQLLNWCGLDFIPQIIMDGTLPPIEGFDIYIASYDILRRFSKEEKIVLKSEWGHSYDSYKTTNPFYTFGFKGIILDEVQVIKGESKRAMEVKNIAKNCSSIVALSGTPIKNSAAEYWTILNILKPDLFPSREQYIKNWVETENINGYDKHTGIKSWRQKEWNTLTSSFIIRRTREQVREQIGLRVTKANRIFHHVDFESDKLKAQYEREEAKFIRDMEEDVKKKNPIDIIARLSLMRHLVGLSKIQAIVDYAEEFFLENARPLIILLHHIDVTEAVVALLSKTCAEAGLDLPLYYKAGLSDSESFALINKALNTNCAFFIGSTLAMGEGVDKLQHKFRDMIIGERQWNPANEEQAESRLVRIGQKHDFVDAIYPIATDTIDEYFTEIVERKRRAMKSTLDGEDIKWEEFGLLNELYDAIKAKGRKNTKRGF